MCVWNDGLNNGWRWSSILTNCNPSMVQLTGAGKYTQLLSTFSFHLYLSYGVILQNKQWFKLWYKQDYTHTLFTFFSIFSYFVFRVKQVFLLFCFRLKGVYLECCGKDLVGWGLGITAESSSTLMNYSLHK